MLKRNISKIFILAFVCMTIFFLLMPIVEAAPCPLCNGVDHGKKLKGTKGAAYDMACTIYSGQLFDTSNDPDKLSTAGVLAFETGSVHFQGLWSQGEQLYIAMAGLGKLLCVIYALIFIMEASIDDTVTPEKILKIFIKMVVGVLVIENGFDILTAGADLATLVFNNLSDTPANFGGKGCNYQAMLDTNGVGAFFEVVALFPPYAIILGMKAIILVLAWVRILDIMIRIIFAPIGMSDMLYEGTNGNGFRYFKKMVASALQGGVMIGIARAYSTILNIVTGKGFGGYIIIILMLATATSLMWKSQTIASDVTGT